MIRVLLTGGTGSFGRGFIKTLLEDKSEDYHVRVYSRCEHKQRQLLQDFPDGKVACFLGDIRDKERLERVARGVDWIVHAAALKQAPLGETEAQEFIKTNIQGSLNVIEAGRNAEKCLLISSDKAVEPINLYGATKMVAEKAFLQADALRDSPLSTFGARFACTRYGNVAGTSGSIIPLFQALRDDEPTPITDPAATRFWISLSEANRFVLETMRLSDDRFGGKIHTPKLKSVSVAAVAEAIRPGKPFKVIGLRPGDKLHEKLDADYSSGNNEQMSVEDIRQAVAA